MADFGNTPAKLAKPDNAKRLAFQAGAAMRAGVSPATLKEALIQVAIYAGVPAANTAFSRAAAIIRAHRM